MAYRLYTHDVQEGITDFDDMKYHMLKHLHDYSLIFNEFSEQFIVAYHVRYHELDSIDWAQGHYFDDVIEATDYFEQRTMNIRRFFLHDPAPTAHTIDTIMDTMRENRDYRNIPNGPLDEMLDITIQFMLDNEELFDEDVIEDIRNTLAD